MRFVARSSPQLAYVECVQLREPLNMQATDGLGLWYVHIEIEMYFFLFSMMLYIVMRSDARAA